MVAAGLWKRQDIDRIEASLYRKVLGVSNMISNRVILNTMTSIRLAGKSLTIWQRKHGSSSGSKTESPPSSKRNKVGAPPEPRRTTKATRPTISASLNMKRYGCLRLCWT
jgi:hypothetical protein